MDPRGFSFFDNSVNDIRCSSIDPLDERDFTDGVNEDACDHDDHDD
jgi:hypothetical protein